MSRSWSILDFFIVFFSGVAGAMIAFGIALLVGNDDLLLALGILGQALGYLVAIWVLGRFKDDPDLGFAIEPADALYVGAGLLLQLAMAVLFLPLSNLLFPDGDPAQGVSSVLAELESPAIRIFALLGAVIVAPVSEELVFRGVLLKAVGRLKNWLVMVVTAAVFAGVHIFDLDSSRFFEAFILVIPQLFIVGLLLAWVTLRSKRLGPAIFLHSGFNLLAALVLLLPADALESIS